MLEKEASTESSSEEIWGKMSCEKIAAYVGRIYVSSGQTLSYTLSF